MIRIVRETGPKGFVSIRALGHADFGARGKDVVCAAASALLQAWLRNLMEVLGERLHVELDRKAGRMVFIVPADADPEARQEVERLVRYFYPSIQTLAEQYPENILLSEIGSTGFAGVQDVHAPAMDGQVPNVTGMSDIRPQQQG